MEVISCADQQLRQLRDIGRDPPRLVFREHLGRRSPPRFFLVIDIGKLLAAAVLSRQGRCQCARSTRAAESGVRSRQRFQSARVNIEEEHLTRRGGAKMKMWPIAIMRSVKLAHRVPPALQHRPTENQRRYHNRPHLHLGTSVSLVFLLNVNSCTLEPLP
jgi:hypothetical protein